MENISLIDHLFASDFKTRILDALKHLPIELKNQTYLGILSDVSPVKYFILCDSELVLVAVSSSYPGQQVVANDYIKNDLEDLVYGYGDDIWTSPVLLMHGARYAIEKSIKSVLDRTVTRCACIYVSYQVIQNSFEQQPFWNLCDTRVISLARSHSLKSVVDYGVTSVKYLHPQLYDVIRAEIEKPEYLDAARTYLKSVRDTCEHSFAAVPRRSDTCDLWEKIKEDHKAMLDRQEFLHKEFEEILSKKSIKDDKTDSGNESLITEDAYNVLHGFSFLDVRSHKKLLPPSKECHKEERKELSGIRVENPNNPEQLLAAEQRKEEIGLVFDKLNSMIGLTTVKDKMKSFDELVQYNQLAKELCVKSKKLSLHSLFIGNPGTGKTTVAELWGNLLYKYNLLSKGHVVKCTRSDFIGQYYGDVEENLKKIVADAMGGVLFIDEAYSLCPPSDPKDPGHEVMSGLLTLLADESMRDISIVLAGYTHPMEYLISTNPGLRSRFPDQNIFFFEDYNADELMQIAKLKIEKDTYMLSWQAEEKLRNIIEMEYEHREIETFGNGRWVSNMLEYCYLKHVHRIIASHNAGEEIGYIPFLTYEDVDIDLPEKRFSVPVPDGLKTEKLSFLQKLKLCTKIMSE